MERRRVLVVEDSNDSALAFRLLLEAQGFEVAIAVTGKLGVEVARRWVPDVMLLDIGLPGMDGYEVARALRADPTTADVAIIAMSGFPPDPEREQAAGFSGRLAKPVPRERLLALLRTAGTGPQLTTRG